MGFEGNGRNGCSSTRSGSSNVLVAVVMEGSCGFSSRGCSGSCNGMEWGAVVELWKDCCGVTCCMWS